ncbi:MAG: hypothetical protein [Podoviridae sp. ctviO18]|nr:MAG: hypothetical protein [Podoviridae sp. ctviO18]
MGIKTYSRYMNERSQATPEGAKIHAESVRQIEAIKSFPKRMIKKAVGKIKKVFNRYK